MIKLHGTMKIQDNMLSIGGVATEKLKAEFGTPLYVIDEEAFVNQCKRFKDAFKHPHLKTEVIYASKAFMALEIARLMKKLDLSMDMVSGGEIYTAHQAGFPMEKTYFHGNNKLKEEIDLAIQVGVGTIVVDHEQELDDLIQRAESPIHILLRVNPGVEAHTHEYIQTAKLDSKFGESIFDDRIFAMVNRAVEAKNIILDGFHCHIGSQVFAKESFLKAADTMLDFTKTVEEKTGYAPTKLNLGGGFGIYYSEEDQPFDTPDFLAQYLDHIYKSIQEKDLKIDTILIEPGRSLISPYGSTLYTIGGVKNTYGGKRYIFIDGGMTDNPRYALYQAKYEAYIANKMNEATQDIFTVSGKCCESGDIVIKDCPLPEPKPDDLLLVTATGAYNFSMSSNYNRLTRPAVVFVNKGQTRLVVKRQTYDDLIRNDI